jgi:Uma2 family endonuclease
MFQLDERNCLIPDVSVLRPGHIPPGSTGSIQGAPEIAIEVVSSETAVHLENKIDLYLAHGSKSVWVVFPAQRIVRIFDASGQARKFEQNQTLEDPSVLPGFRVPVSAIFEGL